MATNTDRGLISSAHRRRWVRRSAAEERAVHSRRVSEECAIVAALSRLVNWPNGFQFRRHRLLRAASPLIWTYRQ